MLVDVEELCVVLFVKFYPRIYNIIEFRILNPGNLFKHLNKDYNLQTRVVVEGKKTCNPLMVFDY